MNTSDILKTIDQEQKVLDKDSFSIIQKIVENMEEYDDFYYRAKTRPKYKQVLHELEIVIYSSTPVQEEDEVLADPAVKSIIIKESYVRDMINQIKAMNRDLQYDIEWDVSEEEMYRNVNRDWEQDRDAVEDIIDSDYPDSDYETDFQNTTLINWGMFI